MASGSNPNITVTAQDKATAILRSIAGGITGVGDAATAINEKIERFATVLKGAIIVEAALKIKEAVTGIAESFDELENSSQAAGVAALALSEYRSKAQQSGVGADELGAALTKLNVKLADAAGGGTESAKAFAAMGVATTDSNGKIRSTEAVLADVADKFATYKDGAAKSALAVELFGKSGAHLIAYLNQGGEALRQYSGITEEGIKKGVQLQHLFDQLATSSQIFKNQLAESLLPSLISITQRFVAASNAGDGFIGTLQLLHSGIGEDPGKQINELTASLADLGEQKKALQNQPDTQVTPESLIGASSLGVDQIDAQIANVKRKLAFFKELQRNAALQGQEDYRQEGSKRDAPIVPKDGVDDAAKKQLDAFIKFSEQAAKEEQDQLASRNKFIELYNSQSLLSIEQYYQARKNAAQLNADAQIKIIDGEIQAERAYQAKAPKASDRADAEGKINVLLLKRAESERKAGEEGYAAAIQEKIALHSLALEFDGLNAQVLDLQGNFAAAAAIRFDDQYEKLKNIFTRQQNEEGLRFLDTLRANAVAQGKFAEQTQKSEEILHSLRVAEDRISLSQQTGNVTELEGLVQISKARAAQVEQLREIAHQKAAIALASGDKQQIQDAVDADLAYKQLAASVDLVAKKFNDEFKTDFTDSFEGFIEGTKTASQAFRDFAKSIESSLSKIATQDIADRLFGGTGSSSGSGGSLSGIGDYISNFLSGARADGGPVSANSSYLVGERGPEIFKPSSSGTIISNSKSIGGNTINIHLAGATDHRTASQIGASVSRELAIHDARNN